MENKIVKTATIANPQNWPVGTALETYGEQEVDELYTHFKEKERGHT